MRSSAAAGTTPTSTRRISRCWRRRSGCPISGCRASRSSRRRSTARLAASGPQLVEVDMMAIGPFARIVRRPAGGRGGQRVMTTAMSSVLSRLAQPLRRGEVEDLRGLTIDEPIELQGAAASASRFLRHHLQRAARAARLPSSRGSPGSPVAPSTRRSNLSGAVFLNDAPLRQRALPPRRDVLGRRVPRRRLLRSGRVRRRRVPRPHDLLRQPLARPHPLRRRGLAAGQRVLRRPVVQPHRVRGRAPTFAASRCMAAPGWSAPPSPRMRRRRRPIGCSASIRSYGYHWV